MPFSLLAGLANTIGSSVTANRQNRFNRDFQAQQAQLARDWQEDFYNKYSSPSAMVQQYKDAGLNPAMMYGRGSSVVGGVPSGASPSGGSQMMPTFSLDGKFGDIIQLKEMIKNNESQRKLQAAQANELNSRSSLNQSHINLNSVNVSKVNNEIEEIKARTKNESDRNGLIALEKTFKQLTNTSISYDNLKKEWAENYKKVWGTYPAESDYQFILKYVDALLRKFGIIGNFVE